MKKAERIYTDTYFDCKYQIRTFGYEENVGFNSLSYNDNETVSTRTLNEIQKYIDSGRKKLEIDIKLNKEVLDMVQVTLDNTRKSHSNL